MAVAKSDSGTPNVAGSGVSSLSLTTFSTTGSASLLIAFLSCSSAPSGISLTWNSVSLTAGPTITNSRFVQIFYLVNPAIGNKTLAGSWTGSVGANLAAISFSGTDTVTGIRTADNVTASGAAATTEAVGAITSTTDGATVALVATTAQTLSTTDQTQIYLDNSLAVRSAASYALGGSSNTHDFASAVGVTWAGVGVHILAPTGNLFRQSMLNGIGIGGPFFSNPLGRHGQPDSGEQWVRKDRIFVRRRAA